MTMSKEQSQKGADFIVVIDGPAGAGKSTVAKLLAERLGFSVLDTGALYRAVAIHLSRQGVSPADETMLGDALESLDLTVEPDGESFRIFLGSEDTSGLLRDEEIGEAASVFSSKAEVRRALLALQRSIGRQGRIVVEGRDMGTVVFPEAQIKFFVTADLEERGRRRWAELVAQGRQTDRSEVRSEMAQRDGRDETREEAPLRKAPDALLIDSTGLTVGEVVDRMIVHIAHKFPDAMKSSNRREIRRA